jgi:hypothetical protein
MESNNGPPNPDYGLSITEVRARHLLLIRLSQQAPTGSVGPCPGRRSQRTSASSKRSSPQRKPAGSTWLGAGGRMGSHARAVGITAPTNWLANNSGNVPVAGTRRPSPLERSFTRAGRRRWSGFGQRIGWPPTSAACRYLLDFSGTVLAHEPLPMHQRSIVHELHDYSLLVFPWIKVFEAA